LDVEVGVFRLVQESGAGIVGLAAYEFVATLQPDAKFGRILAAYGGIFVAGSLAWDRVVDGFEPDRFDLAVGVGTGFLHDGIGGLYNIAAVPTAQRRGAGVAVTAWLTNRLLANGASTVVLQASPLGAPVYERLGFVTYGHYRRVSIDPRRGRVPSS
jgi:drug/metabolite transporter superfamily protein YnfA